MRHLGTLAILLLAVSMVCAAGVGYADTSPPSTSGWTITPTVDGDSVRVSIGIDNTADLLSWNGLVTRTWGDPTLSDPSKFIALGDSGLVLQSLTVGFDGDPVVKLKFSVANTTDLTKDCYYSALLDNFGTIHGAIGTATAGVTVTDCSGDGALATGIFDGCFYRASYNTETSNPQVFKSLVSGPITAEADRGNAVAQTWPWEAMGNPVTDMQAEFGFRLSPNDSASGTSSFTVVPEPGAIAGMLSGMLGLAGFVFRRRIA